MTLKKKQNGIERARRKRRQRPPKLVPVLTNDSFVPAGFKLPTRQSQRFGDGA
jgi:hypothetical protein